MRLFTALDLAPEVLTNLERLLAKLKPAAPIKWSPPKNLHITTKFIGEWPGERLEELKAALRNLPAQAPISITIAKLGFFPNPHAARVFWAGVQAGDALPALARATDDATATLGVAKESRPYSPHLTLARIASPGRLPGLLKAIAALPSLEFGAFTAARFYLYQSQTSPAGSVYTKLAEFPLAK
ncbi:MAG: RNA 2',3'-cyclic phosphodiesterase [Candidatus Solibacter usitatus]|nr:RNA 2',3'-cyclic phosphodiesterase [Candidatus Solibacter usitatus]